MSIQPALDLQLNDQAAFHNFYPGENVGLIGTLEAFASQQDTERFIYLWGASGSGCTHLLQAVCTQASAQGQTVTYLPLARYAELSPAMLCDLHQVSLVCVDDIGAIAQKPAWERALFHFYNEAKAHQTRVLVAADRPPAQLRLGLADLRSRWCASLVVRLHALTDDRKIVALQQRARQRGLSLPLAVGQYLLRHCPRDMGQLLAALDTLDQASLQEQRALTIPFVKKVLAL